MHILDYPIYSDCSYEMEEDHFFVHCENVNGDTIGPIVDEFVDVIEIFLVFFSIFAFLLNTHFLFSCISCGLK